MALYISCKIQIKSINKFLNTYPISGNPKCDGMNLLLGVEGYHKVRVLSITGVNDIFECLMIGLNYQSTVLY